ncbi:hypothetical protein SAY87_022364 [Trapa incisa]|uniref:Uncharacterized protein n=1 Tax=Trapa incisa TaxID=236973 RepID=A0AAN7K7N7_9MYRT|nr:hypothetical protein SAY87_022364 [Trapa incisa]
MLEERTLPVALESSPAAAPAPELPVPAILAVVAVAFCRTGTGVSGGAFYAATVIDSHASTKAQILVAYKRMRSVGRCPPRPPLELGRCFQMGEAVEAFIEYGWHQGIILEVLRVA